MSILSKVFPTSASVWVLWQLIQPRVLGIWKTIAPRQNSSRPTILWLSFLNQCNSVLKSQDLTNGNLVLVHHQKKKTPRDASLSIMSAEDRGRPIHLDSVYLRRYFSVCLLNFIYQCESLWNQLPTQSWGCMKVITACQSLPLQHNCAHCSCLWEWGSTCLWPGCKTPQRRGYRTRRLLRSRTAAR